MDNYYNQISEGYNELHREEQEKKLSIIKQNLTITKETKLLDVGCGTGISSQFDCKVTGIDPAQKLIEIAKKNHPNIRFLVGQAESLPFKDNEFDIVISLTTIQNFEDIEKGLKEIRRVGKRYVLSYLKKSQKSETILRLIQKNFIIEKMLEEDKDLIFFCFTPD